MSGEACGGRPAAVTSKFDDDDFRNTVPRFDAEARSLSDEDLREIGAAQLEAQGHRYGEANERMVDR